MYQVFDKVLYVGPDLNAQGGIASVLRSYSHCVAPFHYVRSNSAKGTIPGLFALVMHLFRLPYFKWAKSINIIHIHSASGKSFVRKSLIIKVAKMLGYKIVFHSHSGYFKDYVTKVGKSKICSILDKCDAIVALSNVWKRYFEEELGYKNVFVINNIVYKVDKIRNNNRHGKLKMLFLGLICDNKGIFDLVNMIAEHKSEFEDKIELNVGGVGEDVRLQNMIDQYGLAQMVKPLGWVSGDLKNELLADCDVIILPSYNEGLPIFILEAMAYSKPVISTTVGGIPEVVTTGENGYLINPGDKEEMLKAINYYLNNPLHIEREGINGYRKVIDYYPDAVRSQLYELYLGLMKC